MTKLYVFLLLMAKLASCEPGGKYSASKYFENTLDEIQGALIDAVNAKNDLDVIENKLEAIVDGSSLIYKTESILENAVAKNAYENAWKDGEEESTDNDEPVVECKDGHAYCPTYAKQYASYGENYFCSQSWATDPNGRYNCKKTCNLC